MEKLNKKILEQLKSYPKIHIYKDIYMIFEHPNYIKNEIISRLKDFFSNVKDILYSASYLIIVPFVILPGIYDFCLEEEIIEDKDVEFIDEY